jgi:hypothetical protein
VNLKGIRNFHEEGDEKPHMPVTTIATPLMGIAGKREFADALPVIPIGNVDLKKAHHES